MRKRLTNLIYHRRGNGDTIVTGHCALCGRNLTLSRANKTGARCRYDGAQYDLSGYLLYDAAYTYGPDGEVLGVREAAKEVVAKAEEATRPTNPLHPSHADSLRALTRELTLSCWRGLNETFAEEFRALPQPERIMLLTDFQLGVLEEGLCAHEYARRIGKGNLASYVRTLIAGNRQQYEITVKAWDIALNQGIEAVTEKVTNFVRGLKGEVN